MKPIYKKILEKAIPYYKKGRKNDIAHVKWLLNTIPKFVDEKNINPNILIPLAILHDVGYAKVPKNANPLQLDIRKLHSVEGAKIAEAILKSLDYPKQNIKEIKRLILKHDNWAFGDSFSSEPYLRIFNNFDFMWVVSPKGFVSYQKIVKKDAKGTIKAIEKAQKENKKQGRQWYSKKIENYYKKLLKEREEEVKKV